MLIDIQNMLDIVAGDAEKESGLRRELNDMADELNSMLSDTHVASIVHFDRGDYLRVERTFPQE